MTYWELGDRYAYITSRGKRGIVDKLSQVPDSAKPAKGASKKPKKRSPKKKKGGKKRMAKKKTKKSSGFRLPGGIGPKAVLNGILGLAIVPRFLPVQSPGAQILGTGLALRALKLGGGGPLSGAGVIMLAGEFLSPYLGGFLGGGNNAAASSGGYDY